MANFETFDSQSASQNGDPPFYKKIKLYALSKSRQGRIRPSGHGIFLVITGVFTFFFIFSKIGFNGYWRWALPPHRLFDKRPAPILPRCVLLQAVSKHGKKPQADRQVCIDEPSLKRRRRIGRKNDILSNASNDFDRSQRDILVTDVKNNPHSEQRMLVIAESGYPEYLQPRVKQFSTNVTTCRVPCSTTRRLSGKKMKQRGSNLEYGCHRTCEPPVDRPRFFPRQIREIKRATRSWRLPRKRHCPPTR